MNIIYIPLDERPCNVMFPAMSFAHIDKGTEEIKLITTPKHLLGVKKQPANVADIWTWLEDNIRQADAVVCSLEQLLYGGLLPSRLHHLSAKELQARFQKLRDFARQRSSIPWFVFALIMRCPRYNSADEEPDYYAQYGAALHVLGAHIHKKHCGISLSESEKQLRTRIPAEVIEDYETRRAVNLSLLRHTVDAAAEGVFASLTIPRDDSAQYSYSAKDKDMLFQYIQEQDCSVQSYPGADEAGCTLTASTWLSLQQNRHKQKPNINYIATDGGLSLQQNRHKQKHEHYYYTRPTPVSIFPLHSYAEGLDIIPLYEDQALRHSIEQHCTAAGAAFTSEQSQASVVLALHLPFGTSCEVEDIPASYPYKAAEKTVLHFVEDIQKAIEGGYSVVLADLRFVNGGDTALITQLDKKGMLKKLAFYAAWNTNGNTLGTALSACVLGTANQAILRYRLLEDWAYMSVARQTLDSNSFSHTTLHPLAAQTHTAICQAVTKHLSDPWLIEETFSVSFPWHRRFEIQLHGIIDEHI